MADDIKRIKELVEIVAKKIRGIETQQDLMSAQVRMIKDQQSVMNDKLDTIDDTLDDHTKLLNQHTGKLDNHTAALMKIEDTLEGYADMYKVNKEKNDELEERVETIEDKLDLNSKN